MCTVCGPQHVEQAADDRAENHRHVHRRGTQRHGLAELAVRHQVLEHRLRGRHHEGTGAAEQHQDREHRPHGRAAAGRERNQHCAAQQLHGHAAQHDQAPVVAVGHVAGPQDQHQERRKLRQADQAKIEQAAGDLVHLPADRHALHLHGKGGEKARRQVERQVAVAQDTQAPGR
jgi:hypothetical protein